MKMAAGSPAGAKRAGFPQQKAVQLSDLDDAAKRFAHGGKVRGVGCAQRGFGKAMKAR